MSAHIKELEALIGEDTSEVTSSRLSKTLTEVIQDNEALIYFIQYLETIERGAMIKFILDVKSFNSALPKFVCYSGTNSDQCNDSCILKNNLKGRLAFKNNNESLISETNKLSKNVFLNCDNGSDIGCEKKISSDVSCQQEFSEVRNTEDDLEENNCDLEENNMIKGLLESSKNSESSADALKIFKKYFSQNAPLKININSSIRKRLIENLNSIVNKESFSEVKEYILKLLEKE